MRPFTPKSRLSFEITHEFKNNSSLILTQALKLIHLYFWQKKLNNFELKQWIVKTSSLRPSFTLKTVSSFSLVENTHELTSFV